MSFITFRLIDVYARWREAFLRSHPERRLFPESREDPETPTPFITVGEKGKKIGVVILALVALLALSNRK